MPNGSTHTTGTLITAAALAVVGVYAAVRYNQPAALSLPIGALAGLLLSPDLDIEQGSIANHHARQVNPVFGWLWRVYWWPYGKIAKHRGMSHAPILGTLVRLIYVGWWLPLVWWDWAIVAMFAAGLAIVDMVHVGMDRVF